MLWFQVWHEAAGLWERAFWKWRQTIYSENLLNGSVCISVCVWFLIFLHWPCHLEYQEIKSCQAQILETLKDKTENENQEAKRLREKTGLLRDIGIKPGPGRTNHQNKDHQHIYSYLNIDLLKKYIFCFMTLAEILPLYHDCYFSVWVH